MYGVVDLMVGMHYEIESRRFKNTPEENVVYGWEQTPIQSVVAFDNVQDGQLYHQEQENATQVREMANNANETMPFAPYSGGDAPF